MTTPLSIADVLAKLESLNAEATKGPWKIDGGNDVWAADCKIADTDDPKQNERYRKLSRKEREANRRLIVVMRNALPAILAALAREQGR